MISVYFLVSKHNFVLFILCQSAKQGNSSPWQDQKGNAVIIIDVEP